ncbi:hypothetical protein FHS15_004303 [Paenibacillus castaneae]|uniref:hypothetical protein n=1 Tax=Paenibacillus castaneae TaxID=474957 RepID=UPI000C9A8A0D|nr:hypothetical protein [Paenibacillus castaneae]NIK79145.1 hypothetical protein [Paenibacillus castaneae]
MKKTKQPGENISLKTKKSEDPLVMQWLNAQTNLMDSLRYLMEKEIVQNGVRNLQAYVPAERSVLQGSSTWSQEIDRQSFPTAIEQTAAGIETEEKVNFEPVIPVSEPAAEEEIDDDDIEAWS